MTAVARDLSPSRTPRLVVPRPTPKNVVEEIPEVSDTSIHEVVALREAKPAVKPPSLPPSLPPAMKASSPPRALAREPRASHPGLVLAKTLGFFVAALTGDAIRSARAFLKAHWVRASARARH